PADGADIADDFYVTFARDRLRGDHRHAHHGGTVMSASEKNRFVPHLAAAFLATCLFGAARAAAAGDAPAAIDTGDTAWVLAASSLVLMMTLPGLALFYGGLVRAKNVLNVLMQCMLSAGIIGVLWILVGYSLAFSGGNAFIGDLAKAGLSGVDIDSVVAN